jgi:hypothetical protein
MLVAQVSAAELLACIATEQKRRERVFAMWEQHIITVDDVTRAQAVRVYERTERFELELDRARDLLDPTRDTAPSRSDLSQASDILWDLMTFLDDELRPDTTPDEDLDIRVMRRLVHSAMIPLQAFHQEQNTWEESQRLVAERWQYPELGDYWDEAGKRWRPIDVQEELYFMGVPDDDRCPSDFDSACLMRLATYTDGLVSDELTARRNA